MYVLFDSIGYDIPKLLELDERAQASITHFSREIFIMDELSGFSGAPYVLLQGPR